MIENFGGNVVFQPAAVETPRTEADVLACLARHRGRRIRVAGRLHSWSDAVRAEEVLLDLRHLNNVQIVHRDGGRWVTVDGGCPIKKLLAELEQSGFTLPAVGLITGQTIAGAAATGTHGSGRHSLSHYLAEVRVAGYDINDKPVIRTISEGPELQAARCSLGCLGVVVSVGLCVRPTFHVEEHFARYASLSEVLAEEDRYPLQQFYLVPWSWHYYVQHRRETIAPRSRLATLYRWYCFLTLDLGLHLGVIALVKWFNTRWSVRMFYRHLLPWTVIRGCRVVDRSSAMLVMRHELFRHIEIEVFVRGSQLGEAMRLVEQLLRHADGEPNALSTDIVDSLRQAGQDAEVASLMGRYRHHYPICIRRVLPDDTLLSMASGDEPWYAISFISYATPADRHGFFEFARVLTGCVVRLFDGRVHWGKVCPLDSDQARQLYPRLTEFRRISQEYDPAGVFRNEWIARLLFDKYCDVNRVDGPCDT